MKSKLFSLVMFLLLFIICGKLYLDNRKMLNNIKQLQNIEVQKIKTYEEIKTNFEKIEKTNELFGRGIINNSNRIDKIVLYLDYTRK